MGKDSYSKRFARAIAIRAAKTFCQTAVAYIGTAAAMGDVDWTCLASTSVLAALASVLTSIAKGLPEVKMPKSDDVDLDENV